MTNQSSVQDRDRGGIQLRDWTQGGGPRRRFKLNIDQVARGLIFVSLGLGLMEIFVPRRVQKMAGVKKGDFSGLIRFAGFRELASAFLIYMQGRPHAGVWSRVVGDAMDLGLLGAAFSRPKVRKNNLAYTTAFIAGTTALDAVIASQLARKRKDEKQISTITMQDLNHRTRGGAFHVSRSITINRPVDQLYQFWRNFENLPQFMYHLQSVQVMDDRHSHWVAKAPAGKTVAWDAEITDDQPDELIAWQTTENASVPNSGVVRFIQAPGNRGTVVHVEIDYRPPGGAIGKAVAFLFGEEPAQQVAGDLKRFKQVMETGEVLVSDGSPQGFGQKMQRPARPLPEDYPNKEKNPRISAPSHQSQGMDRVTADRIQTDRNTSADY